MCSYDIIQHESFALSLSVDGRREDLGHLLPDLPDAINGTMGNF